MNQLMSFDITEYNDEFQKAVINLVGKELRSWKVLAPSDDPITDEDLYNIPTLYAGRNRFWVALKDGEVIGTVGVREFKDDTAIIRRMFVLDEFHGAGVGQSLLDTAIRFVRKNKYKEIILNSHPLLTRSHRFYQKNGFVLEGKDKERLHFRLKL